MKKISIVSLFLMAAVSCQIAELNAPVEDAVSEVEQAVYYVGMEEEVDTKTSSTIEGDILWTAGDKMNIFYGPNNNDKDYLELKGGEGTKNGSFYGPYIVLGEDEMVELHQTVIAYPFDENSTCVPNEDKTAYTLSMNIPAVQQYVEGSFANGAYPMVGVTENPKQLVIETKNVASIINFRLKGTASISKIVLSSDKLALAGPASVVASYGNVPVATITEETASKTVELICDGGVQLSEDTDTYFNIVVAPCSGAINVTFYDTAGGYTVRTLPADANYNRGGRVNYNHVYTGENSIQKDLANAFKNGGEYTLPMDVTVSEALLITGGKTLNLNLNGYTLTSVADLGGTNGCIQSTGAELNIANGKINNKDGYLFVTNGYNDKLHLELTDVDIKGSATSAFYFADATEIVLNNVNLDIKGKGFYSFAGTPKGSIEINGGTYKTTGKIFDFKSTLPVVFKGNCLFSKNDYAGAQWVETGDMVYPWKPNGVSQPEENVVYITSSTGLEWVAEQVNTGAEDFAGKTINLMADLDLSKVLATRSAAVSNWTPIGTEENPFSGTFDGKGYTIKNLTIVENEAKEGKAYIGFFGYAKNATIKNVTFENVNINIPCLDIDHSQGHIGAVAGSLEGTSTIEDITVKGDVKVEATVTANGASRVAVVAGGNSYGNVTMKNVHVVANDGSYLKANNNVGALAGQLQGKSVFENCSSNIDVTGTKFFAGGIIGIAAGDQVFTNCHTTGDVTITAGRSGRANDHYRVGGIAGGWADGKTKVCTLTDCSYTGKLSGTNADGSVVEAFDYAGYVGRGYTLSNCAGSKVVIDGVEYIQVDNSTYGVYTVDGVYEMNTLSDLQWFAAQVNEGDNYFEGHTLKLANDIDLNNVEWTPIGSAYKDHGFMGNFDGNGKTIKNLKMTKLTPDADGYVYAGLFGVTEGIDANNQNYIKNLVIENVTIETTGHIAAAAIAYPYYTVVENVTVKGDIKIKGGDYTSGALAYTRRCVNAKDITVEGNPGSYIIGNNTIGGVISDIQTNGGLVADYSNFKASGLTISGNMHVGGISGIISKQTLNGATVKNLSISCEDNRKGIVAGSLGDTSTITNIVFNNVTGATNLVGATYKNGSEVINNEGVFTAKN